MWPATRPRADPDLLDLFDAFGGNLERATVLLRDLLATFPDDAELAREVLACEREGDRLAHEILRHAAGHGRTCALEPIDVHALTGALDDVIDYAEEAADRLGLYGVEAPTDQAQQLAGVLVAAAAAVAQALHAWRAGQDVAPRLVEIHRLENDADHIVRQAVASLFATGIDPLLIIRWKDIYESLESAVDSCEKVAHVLEGIALKRANGHH